MTVVDREPGSLSAWWWRHMRGWPEGLPFNRRTLNRAKFNLLRTSVREEMHARFKRTELGLGAADAGYVLPILMLPALIQIFIHLLRHPIVIVGAMLIIFTLQFMMVRRLLARRTHPSVRASLRREGINCCVRCGQLIDMGGDAATCPECGMEHTEFPLRWGPGEIGRTPFAKASQ